MVTPGLRILVVEDDPTVRATVRIAFETEGYQVQAECDGLAIEAVADGFRPDLAILDVRLAQGPSGLSMAGLLRGNGSDLPIIFLTAADDVDDRLAGFRAGGDDYLTKPFAIAELLARVQALLRRSGRLSSDAWQVGDLVVDEGARTASRAGKDLQLTRREFDLLVGLGSSPGRVMSKTQLLTTVWGFDEYDPNLVEVHISSLRRKLEAADGSPRLVHTVRGVGYVLRP
jgi:two-component system, OmpR family, response regulator